MCLEGTDRGRRKEGGEERRKEKKEEREQKMEGRKGKQTGHGYSLFF